MKKANWIHLGTSYALNEKYSKSYSRAFFYISLDGQEVKVELWSNWNRSYNTEEIHRTFQFGTPFDVIKNYIGRI